MTIRVKYFVECDEHRCRAHSKLYVKKDTAITKAIHEGFEQSATYPEIFWCGIHAPRHADDIADTLLIKASAPKPTTRSYGTFVGKVINARMDASAEECPF